MQRFAVVLLSLSCLATGRLGLSQESGRASGSSMTDQLVTIVKTFRGEMGIAAIDLRSRETIAVNADMRFPTASTIKSAVMIEAWQRVEDGRLSMDTVIPLKEADRVGGSGILRGLHDGIAPTVADLIHLMIVLSDNTATNLLIDKLGTAQINARLETYGLHDTKLFRPTFRDGRPDVLPDLERQYGLGMTTPREMAMLMAAIADGKAVSRTASDAMLGTLRRQQDRAMIARDLPTAGGVQVGNKTGTDEEKHAGPDGVKRHVRADAAIVTGPTFAYVLAIYARQIEDTRWSVDNEALVAGGRISRMVFDYFSLSRDKK